MPRRVRQYLVFDLETTGLLKHPAAKDSAQPRAIEFGGVLLNSRGEVLDEAQQLINPGQPLEAIITKVTGLTDADLAGAPHFAEVAPRLRMLFAAADVVIAHNLAFDRGVIEAEVARNALVDWPWPARWLCSMQEHAEEWGGFAKLAALYEAYLGKPLAQTHRALDDVRALVEVCQAAELIR